MGLCKCPKRKVTNLFCFVHKVNVCESCMVEQHARCEVRSYMKWLEDSDFDPTCSLCANALDQGEVLRLVCYDLYHVACLDKYASAIANGSKIVCPKCQEPVIPSTKLVSPVADVVRRCVSQFSWAAATMPTATNVVMAPGSQAVDTTDGAGQPSTTTDFTGTPSFGGSRDHAMNFHQSDPVNRGHKFMDAPVQVTMSTDSDDDKYKRRGTMERISRTLKNYQTTSVADDGSFLMRRYWFFAVLIVFSLLSLIVLITRVGRSMADRDPLLDIKANPHIMTGNV